MKISLRMLLLFALLLAAICYTIYNWVIGTIDANAAIMYILVLCFPIIRWLSAFVKHLKADPEWPPILPVFCRNRLFSPGKWVDICSNIVYYEYNVLLRKLEDFLCGKRN